MSVLSKLGASTAGGWTPHRRISAGTDDLVSVKATPGQVGYVLATNINAAVRYLHLFNKASAPVLASDSALLVHTFAIPGSATGGGVVLVVPAGIEFTTGIAFAITTVAAGTTGAVAAGELLINLGYK